MWADPEQEGLIVSRSDTPVVRAGWLANIMMPFLIAVWSVLINQVLKDLGIAPFIRGAVVLGVCLVGARLYSRVVCRIFIKNGKTLVVLGPFAATEINADDILKTDVCALTSCGWIILEVKRKSSRLPAFYHIFVAPVTNYGGCADTAAKLRVLLKRLSHTEA
jgi:hypothetical protein